MTIKIPDSFMGRPIEGAIERVLSKQKTKEEQPKQEITPNLDGFIYVPSIKLHVAKEKTLYEKNWYKAHEELHKQNLQMLTIRQFVDFINYLRKDHSNRKEASAILDEILTARSPWRSEWLDAKFTKENEKMYINYNHRTVNGKLKPQKSELLENCLMEDCCIDLNSANKQGLPTKKENIKKKVYYWYPKENYVARFGADSGRAALNCDRDPEDSDSSLGVRAARAKS